MEITAFRTAARKPLLVAIVAATLACSGQDGASGADGKSVLLRTTIAGGADCANGGVKVESGLDANRDGLLADAEVQSTVFACNGADGRSAQATPEAPGASCAEGGVALTTGSGGPTYVCNGAPGATGQAGQAGQDGRSVTATPEAAGANCPYGGTRLQVGAGTPTYVCAGAPGATGQAGQDGQSVAMTPEAAGSNCPYGGEKLQIGTGTPTYVCNGAPGAAGQDGLGVTVTSEPAGLNCTYGGQRLQVGNGTSTYVCNGAPGSAGQAGRDGQSVVMTPEAPGQNCTYGGQRLQVGSGDATYVCNGAPGAVGQDGQSVTMTPEPPGANCVFGGVAVRVGSGPESYLCSGAPVGVTLPVVETVDVTPVRYVEAVVNGIVTDSGGELVIARGAVLATHSDPSLRDTIVFSGAGVGAFATACLDLAPGTTYWVRAFATNALGTSYGGVLSFRTSALTVPTLLTHAASNVTATTAISGGDITDDGGTPILGRGICWSQAADPTSADSCASEGVGAGSYLALATGLGGSKTYHVRAYATNAQGTSYGDDRSFTTAALPLATVITASPTAVSYTTATGGGNVTADNGAQVTSRGICWGASPSPTTAGARYVDAGTLGAFTGPITGLAANTTYYVRAFAVNSAGTSYGNEVSFKTLPPAAPSLTTKAVGGISSNIAGSGGIVTSDGGSPITAKGVCWDLNPNPTIANSKTTDGTGAASFNSTVSGLAPLTTYHVRAYATNALGTAYGNDVSFTTSDLVTGGPTVPVLGTSSATMSTSTTAASGGYVSSDGGSPVTVRGVCWSTSPNPTLAGTCSTDGGTGEGFFTSTVTGLSGCAVPYYVRAYATNSTGTGYGNQVTFSTGLLPTLTTAPPTGIGHYDATSGGTIADSGGCPITQKGVVWSWTANPTTGNSRTTDGTGDTAYASTLTGLYANRTYYVRAYATTMVGTAYGNQEMFTTAEPAGPYVGRNYGGGIVFYVDGTGQHGLVVAPSDQGTAPWGCYGTVIGTGAAVGTGATNTAAIVARCADANIAAKVADNLVLNGYDDWFLPSHDELDLMYTNLYAQGLGGLGYGYWSSTEYTYNAQYTVWFRYFQYGSWDYYSKPNSMAVRAVRAF